MRSATSSAAARTQYEINGFKFDGGPTVMTVPDFFDEIYEAAGRKREDYFKLTPLDPFYRIFNHEGRAFNYWHGTEETIEEIRKFNPADVDGYRKYVGLTEEVFRPFNGLTDRPFLQPDRYAQDHAGHRPPAGVPRNVHARCALHQGRLPAPGLLVPPAAGGRQPV